ncbi:glycoside hydrolase family 97 protein [Aestuariibaculum suncheonense]|uniref:Glycoside hydrolase family 97 protein n=2 Tax=Aestuariibaculum suncheonense TaxID=1028745 RepID=A0A8J6UG53_9FLAO|nr:glycoside hydrolase family 97 protein [Aestuariibaculum suncheonense]
MIMKYQIATLFLLILVIQQSYCQTFEVESPDKKIKLSVNVAQNISWSVTLNKNLVIKNAIAGMDFSTGADFGNNSSVKKHTIKEFSTIIHPVVPHKDSEINDEYNELSIEFKSNYELKFRAYNDGVAYRFVDQVNKNRNIISEHFSLTFPEGTRSYFPQEASMYSHNERVYLDKALTEIKSDEFCSLPVMFSTSNAKVLYTETALHDYPGMFIKGTENSTVEAIFPKYVIEAIDTKNKYADRSQEITKEANYIAQTSGNRAYPWRVFIISDDDKTFVESNLTFQLSKPSVLKNTSWIKPGKVAWDWYNDNNVYGVDFKSGLNTATYKYFIDFAAANGIEYVILDEGWTKSTTEILDFNPNMDIPKLIQYGKEKGVELILWVLWKPLDANLDEILETYKTWGVKGIKVDYMQRNDQYMVNSYERIAKKCAELKLLVDFHGSFKPSGLRRTYPNVINYEGVKGGENNKMNTYVTPEHNVTIPFIRMAAGPMDYTPGAMVNKHKKDFSVSFKHPMSQGTRAHQVAMYVVYEAPLQMLCDSPSRYYEEQETLDFITKIPTVWDETTVLKGVVGDYIAIARRKDNKWYIGAMTDWNSRDLELDLSFLKEGNFKMEIYKDGVNAEKFAEDYTIQNLEVNKNSKIEINMAPGGGWSAIISEIQKS